MEITLTHQDLMERATRRRESSDFGVGAAYDCDVTERGRDGRRWRLMVTDTMHGFAYVDVVDGRVGHEADLPVEPIEDAVEQIPGRYLVPAKERMAAMVADYKARGPLRIRLDR